MQTVKSRVQPVWYTTTPIQVVMLAAAHTMRKIESYDLETKANLDLVKYLYQADHRSVLEHAVLCVQITGVSRAFMAQITRHRLASYTCSSQHYQDYSQYPMIANNLYTTKMVNTIEQSLEAYREALDLKVPKDEARMVLPEALTVNMIMTANAREWAEILHQRLCNRNTHETRVVARQIREVCMEWFPELFKWVGPQCFEGQCRQGKLSCKERRYDPA